MKATELLIEKIKKDYSEDVSLVIIMGSTIYNDTHNRSDIDMFYVPKTERGYNLTFTCIIDGIGYDFWGLSWERLTSIADHEERIASVITEGQVLYCATDEDRQHLNALKEKAADMSDKKRLSELADQVMKEACADVVAVEASKTIRDARFHSIAVIYAIGQVLALINGTTIKRGRGKLKGEILEMPVIPKRFEALYDSIFFSDDINVVKDSALHLFVGTNELVQAEKDRYTETAQFKEKWAQLYEELINAYNKIEHAYEVGDPVTALFAASELVNEIESVSAHTGVDVTILPDFIAAYDPKDLSLFLKSAREHKSALEKLIEDNDVFVRRFADFTELEKYMEKL